MKISATRLLLTTLVFAGGLFAQTTISGTGGTATTVANSGTGVSISSVGSTDVSSNATGTGNVFRVIGPNSAQLFRVQADGDAAILGDLQLTGGDIYGTTNSQRLELSSTYGTRLFYDANNYLALGGNAATFHDSLGITMRIDNGNVGIGVGVSPMNHKLVVGGNIRLSTGGSIFGDTDQQRLRLNSGEGASLQYNSDNYVSVGGNIIIFRNSAGEAMRILNGDVSIATGLFTPATPLHVGAIYPVRFRNMAAQGAGYGIQLEMTGTSEIRVAGMQIGETAIPVIQTTAAAGAGALYLNRTSNNDVIIGGAGNTYGLKVQATGPSTFAGSLTVAGALAVNGTVTGAGFAAKYRDVAEWVDASTDIADGTVVILNPEVSDQVMPSVRAYDTTVAGVVSAAPGLLLGEALATREKIATTGRVKVKVDATSAPIRIGDLLVTSDKPGTAMKSQPVDLAGLAMHRPGTIIGKALEPLATGTGEILVLLSMQ